ncbi:hypothetical protein HID58_054062, partial [Brassica napus]
CSISRKKPTAVTQDEWVTAALTEDAVVVKLLMRLKHAGTVESTANTPLLRWVTQDEWVTAALTEDAVVVELLLRLKHAGTVESAANTPLLRWGSRKPISTSKEWSFDGISHTDTREYVLKLEMLLLNPEPATTLAESTSTSLFASRGISVELLQVEELLIGENGDVDDREAVQARHQDRRRQSQLGRSCQRPSQGMQILSFEQEPVIFLKPTSSYLENGGTIEIPHPLDSLYHEVELAVVIGKKATRDVPESTAMDYVGGKYCFPV